MVKETEENPRLGVREFPAFPVCLITVGQGKEANIITAALVHVFSFDPPLVGIGIAPARHSHGLLQKEDDFVINIPGKELLKETVGCGTTSGSKVDKFEIYGLEKAEADHVKAPLIKQCLVNIECRKTDVFTTGDHDWFIGEVLAVHKEKNYERGKGLLYWAGEFRLPGRKLERKET